MEQSKFIEQVIERMDNDERYYLWRYVNSPKFITIIADEMERRKNKKNTCSSCVFETNVGFNNTLN